jgi:ABC-type branched-subunit amino acid transport system ATPase component/ABC-type branched-subunit amino acid transport system permease subunit
MADVADSQGNPSEVGLAGRFRSGIPWLVALGVFVAAWFVAGALLPGGLPFGVGVQGLIYGGLDAMTAMGLVLIFRSARVINFAQAEIGGLCASVAVMMVAGSHLNYFLGLLIGLVAAAASGALVDLLFIRRLANAPRLIVTVATIGIAQLLGSIEIALPNLYGNGGMSSVSRFKFPATLNFNLGPVAFHSDEVVVMVVVPLVLLGLWWFLGRTDVGIAIRGAADSRDRASLLGVPVRRLSLVAWVVAALLSGIGSVLAQPITGQNVGNVVGPEGLIIPLAAAVIAGMESFPVAFVASLGLGIFEQAIRWSYPQTQAAAVDVAALVVILLALLVRRQRAERADEGVSGESAAIREVRPLAAVVRSLPEARVLRLVVPLVVLAFVVLFPLSQSDSNVLLLSDMVIYGIMAVSLVVLTGWAGQISLGQFAFVGVGGGLTAWALVHHGMNLFLALLVGGAVGGLAAVVIGLPALRSNLGLVLAAATLAFAVPVDQFVMNSQYFPAITPSHIPRPILFRRFDTNGSLTFYYVCLFVLLAILYMAINLRRSRAGRSIVAVRDNFRGAAAYGISPLRSRLLAFVISGAMAGIAGGLFVVGLEGIQFGGFDPEQSIVVFTMVVVGGLGSLAGALVGAAYVESVNYFLKGAWTLFASSAGLLFVLMVVPEGIGSLVYRARDSFARWVASRHGIDLRTAVARPATGAGRDGGGKVEVSATAHRAALRLGALEDLEMSAPSGASAADVDNPLITVEGVDAAYGDSQVLFDVDVAVGAGEVVALLGTNGAGKSTLLRVMNGLMRPTKGRVTFMGKDITSWSPQQRAQAGLVTVPGGRGVFPSLTVRENLRLAGWLSRQDSSFIEEATKRALSLFPSLKERIDTRAGLLSGGEQQMLTIAQAMLCKPTLLLIDELSLGLAPTVVGELLRVVRSLAETGVTVMVVEQSVNVATVISKRAIFMERGHVRFSGPTPSLAQQPELLRSVFLRAAAKAQSARGDTSGAGSVAAVASEHSNGKKPPVLQVEHVTKSYGGVMAINDVSLSLDEGEILGIIGTNGAGKTTLFDVCSGFVVPDSGRVLLNGRDITRLGPNWRARNGVGRVFQESRLFPSMTVYEALEVAFECQVEVKDPLAHMLGLGAAVDSEEDVAERAEELLDQLGLSRWHDTFVSELSTGTRRILELGCVMAHNPKLLLLDEPSAGIAQRESEALSELLRGIAEQTRASMVIIEHDVPLVSSVADHLVCMHLGEIISQGPTASVLNDPVVIDAYLGRDEETLASAGPARRDI